MTDDLQPGSGLHPDMDDLIQYSLGVPESTASSQARANTDRVREHLRICTECRARVAEIIGDLGLLAMSAPRIEPPDGAKQRLFQAAGLDLPDVGAKTAAPPRASVVPIRPRRRSPFLIWGGWVVAAACIFYAVHVHNTNRMMHLELDLETAQLTQATASSERAREIMEVLSSPHAQRVTLIAVHSKPQPTGRAVYMPDHGALVFTATNMEPLPPNKTYELWIIPTSGAAPMPAGVFQPDERGMASVMLPKLQRGVAAKAFCVTMEKAGGSAIPTMPILLAGS